MKQFIGTKIINAKPMTRLEYNEFRGWTLPKDENGADEGFLVEYVDGGQAEYDLYNARLKHKTEIVIAGSHIAPDEARSALYEAYQIKLDEIEAANEEE